MFENKRKWLMNLDRKARSQACNIIYWSRNAPDLKKTIQKKKNLSKQIKNLNDIKNYMSNFVWTKEYVDWDPWVVTVLHRDLHDDCDGASELGKYLFELIGKKANIYHLFGKEGGHAVMISEDKNYMVSNSYLIKLDPVSWKDDVYNCFKGRYTQFRKYK